MASRFFCLVECKLNNCNWLVVDLVEVKQTVAAYLKGLRKFHKVLLNLLADVQLGLQPLGFVFLVEDLTFKCTLQGHARTGSFRKATQSQYLK